MSLMQPITNNLQIIYQSCLSLIVSLFGQGPKPRTLYNQNGVNDCVVFGSYDTDLR